MRKIVWLLYGLLVLVMMQPALAAKRLGPPIENLQSEPDRVRIVVAEAIKKPETPGIVFSISERLSGESPDEVLLRTDEETFADVNVGVSYIVAWSYLRRNRNVIGGWEEDPNGPFVVSLLGLGSIALFEDTPENRFLFAAGSIDESGDRGQQLDALLTQMQRPDFRSRGLMISELWLRPDLTEKMDSSQADVLKTILQTQSLDPQHRDFIIRSALRLPANMTSPWLAEVLRKIIIENGSQYDLASFIPGLVRTAARGLQQAGEPGDIELLSILLYSNNPGVAKASLTSMDHLDSKATVAKAQLAIERGWINSDTRVALDRYLRQVQ